MSYHPKRHQRRSIRLPGYDYTQAGLYFVTINAQGGECLLGEVIKRGPFYVIRPAGQREE